jgi:tetratricopeptide (TPR) repeat protein
MLSQKLNNYLQTSLAIFFILALAQSSCSSSAKKDSGDIVINEAEKNNIETGNSFAREGLLKEAIEKYKSALSINSKNKMAQKNLAIVYVRAGQFKLAVKYFEKSVDAFADDFETNYFYGEALRGVNKFADAIFRYQNALKIIPDDPKAMKSLSWSYFKIRYYSEAYSIAKKLSKLAPDDGQVSIILARTLIKLNQTKAALVVIKKAKRTANASSLPYFYSVEGDIHLAMDNCLKASEAYKLALKDQPLLPGSLLGLGRCELTNGNLPKAITYMERAIRIRPNLTEALYFLGKAYEKKDRKKSVYFYKNFEKSAAKDPEFLGQLPEVKEKISSLKSL